VVTLPLLRLDDMDLGAVDGEGVLVDARGQHEIHELDDVVGLPLEQPGHGVEVSDLGIDEDLDLGWLRTGPGVEGHWAGSLTSPETDDRSFSERRHRGGIPVIQGQPRGRGTTSHQPSRQPHRPAGALSRPRTHNALFSSVLTCWRLGTSLTGLSERGDRSPLAQYRSPTETDECTASVAKRTPLGRIGRPEEMAALITFLLSDDASYVTGQTIMADGGLLISAG
jgi:hypothetical protein